MDAAKKRFFFPSFRVQTLCGSVTLCVCVCVCVCAPLPCTLYEGPKEVMCCVPTVAARRDCVTSSLKLGSSVRAPLTGYSGVDPVRLPPLLCCRVKGGRDTVLELFALPACVLSLEYCNQQRRRRLLYVVVGLIASLCFISL